MNAGPSHRKPWILKLGGSVVATPALARWLQTLRAGGGRTVVVAGGGDFADAVRGAQRRHCCDDATAHRMALLAMEQQALLLAGLCPILRPAASRRAIAQALRERAVPVWLPAAMLRGRDEVAESWDVTSDSLAAWLAAALDTSCLILVKSARVATRSTASALARAGIVDRAFPRHRARYGGTCRVLHATEHAAFAQALRTGVAPGAVVAARRRSGAEC